MDAMNIVSLLCLGFTTVSFIQFGLFGTALPLIVAELGIGYDLMGMLMALWISASFVVAPFVGGYIDKVSPQQATIVILVILSLSSLVTAGSTNLAVLSIARILLSFSMPFVWPICAKITSIYLSSDSYGYSTALYDIGSMIGLALTYIVIALIGNNWRLSMFLAGIICLAYIPIMYILLRRYNAAIDDDGNKDMHSYSSRTQNLYRRGLIRLGVLLFLAFFSALYTWGFVVNWLSTFLVKELGYSYNHIAIYMMIMAMISSILEVISGYYSDKVGGLKGKMVIMYIGLIPTAILLTSSVFLRSSLAKITMVSLSIATYRIAAPSFWSIVNEIVPVTMIGRFSSLYTLAGPLAGIASSIVNGYIITLTGSLRYGVLLSSTLLLLSTLLYSTSSYTYRKYHLNKECEHTIVPTSTSRYSKST